MLQCLILKDIYLLQFWLNQQDSQILLQAFHIFKLIYIYLSMGNQQKLKLKPQQQVIVLDIKSSKTLFLSQLPVFPHNYDGLHIWQSGIILARFIINNPDLFKDKYVLELGSGVGIGGLAVLKYTKAKNCILTDYQNEVLMNIKQNCKKNGYQQAIVVNMNWKEYLNFTNVYDIIIGSDILSDDLPLKDVYNLIKRSLVSKGICYFVQPATKNSINEFLSYIDSTILEVKKTKLEGLNYQDDVSITNNLKNQEYNLYVLRKLI